MLEIFNYVGLVWLLVALVIKVKDGFLVKLPFGRWWLFSDEFGIGFRKRGQKLFIIKL